MSEQSAPTVSVVIPVYNSMPYLTGTLESVLAQDVDGLEVIAIDDGSTDGSGDELERFAGLDDRLTVVHQPGSGWPGMPRNRGLGLARGEFVFFMDSDDTMTPHALSAMVAMADPAGGEPADIVIPRFRGTGGRKVQSLFAVHPQGEISIARAMETLSPQKLFRRELLERAGLRFPEEKVRLEDGIFVTRAYTLARRIVFCGADPLYSIALRDDGQNISQQTIEPAGYVASCRRIAELLLDGVPDRAEAERLVHEFFLRKGLRFYVPRRWNAMPPERHPEWVALHREMLRDLVPERLDAATANPNDRRKLELLRAGDVAGMEALVAAMPRLAHTAELVGCDDQGTIELRIEIVPAGEGSLLRAAQTPSQARLRSAAAVRRVLAPLGDRRLVRGAERRLAEGLIGDAPAATALLVGRRSGRTRAVAGRLVERDSSTGALRYAFALTPGLLKRFGRDRVDIWTVAGVAPGLTGARVRVAAGRGAAPNGRGRRVYATNQGNVSLDLRR